MNRNKKVLEKDEQRESYKKKRPRKGGRNSRKYQKDTNNKQGSETAIIETKSQNPYNKLEYYIRDKMILDQATSLSFQSFIGGTALDDYRIPSIMRIFMNPSPGVTYTVASPGLNHPTRSGINMAATKLFNKFSMSSGRNMNYAPQDLATMILGFSALLSMHSYVHRLFQTVNSWNNFNRMFPKAAVIAMGIDYDDLVANYSDYRTRYNALISAVNQLPILINIGYLEKSMSQYSFIFTDDDSPLSQCYIYLPESTWILDETSYSGGTICKTTPVVPRTGVRTFADLMVNVLRPMVDALLQSSTLNLVYADLLNYAAKNTDLKFVLLDPVVDGEVTAGFKSDEALWHIHNMFVVNTPDFPVLGTKTTPFNDVYPDPNINCIIYNPGFNVGNISSQWAASNVIVDSPMPNPPADVRLELSRYIACFTRNTETYNSLTYFDYVILPDYYVTAIDIIRDDPTTPVIVTWNYSNLPTAVGIDEISAVSQFDWHPLVRSYDGATGMYQKLIGDLNFWTQVDVTYIERLNEVVYLGLFEIQ